MTEIFYKGRRRTKPLKKHSSKQTIFVKNQRIENPLNEGQYSFGTFPEIHWSNKILFEAGEIYLLFGQHHGPNSGYGLAHIWAEHEGNLRNKGYYHQLEIANYVASILVNGAKIYTEFGSKPAAQVIKSSLGMVVLAMWEQGNEQFYSVITAFPGEARGTQVGKLDMIEKRLLVEPLQFSSGKQ